MTTMNMVESLNHTLDYLLDQHDEAIILGEDVGRNGGVFKVTEGLMDAYGKDRVVDTPLSEAGIVGTSVGMTIRDMRPIPEIQFLGFAYYAFNQIINHVARIRHRSQGSFHVPLVLRIPYGGGIGSPEHHSESTESMLAHIPGLKVVVPSSPSDAKGLLLAAFNDPDPVIFLEHKKLYRSVEEDVDDEPFEIEIGKARVIKEGDDLTVITWGAMVEVAKSVATSSDKDIEIIDLRTLIPLDTDTIIESVEKTGRVVILHEAPQTGGFGAEISATINEEAIFHLKAPIKRVTGFDTIMPLEKLENIYIPDKKRLSKAIDGVFEY